MRKTIPARLYTDPSTQVDYRRVYDDNEEKMTLVRRYRQQMGCSSCVSSEMTMGLLVCKVTGDACDRTCRRYWCKMV